MSMAQPTHKLIAATAPCGLSKAAARTTGATWPIWFLARTNRSFYMLPTPQIARQIVEVIGQSGTPPPNGVGYYNVGNDRLLDIIEKHYFESYLAEGGAVFKLIVGDYGAGKSHFLYCLRDLAWRHDFVVSKVDLSPKESPYDDQKRVYAAVAGNILWHEGSESSEEKGLARFLE